MKKFVLVLALLTALTGFTFAQGTPESDSMTVTGKVEKHLYVTIDPSLALGALAIDGTTTGDATINVRSNVKDWTMSAKATYGKLTWAGATEFVGYDDTLQIPYTIKLADDTATTLYGPLSFAAADTYVDLEVFNYKTSGGAAGDDFTLTVAVPAQTAGEDWEFGFYQDVITITVAAN